MTMKNTMMISVACGVLAVIFSAIYLHIREAEVAGGGELVDVLVAAVDINQSTLMEPGFVKSRKIPRAYVQPDALTRKEEIAGRVNISKIGRGEQILGTKLVFGGTKSGLSFKLSKGKRAVSISLSEAACAGGLVQPDDRVDIITTFDYGAQDRSDRYTYTLFEDVPVVAVDSRIHSLRNPEGVAVVERESKNIFGSAPQIGGAGSRDRVITFELDPIDAEKLIFANETGEVSIALRSPMDRTRVGNLEPVKIESITGKGGFTRKEYREYRGK